jgi:putative ABC transport system permease protein
MTRRLRRRDADHVAEIERDAQALLLDASRSGRVSTVRVWLALLWDVIARGAVNDSVQALRSFVRDPRFAVSVSLLFGVGIAVTTTIFALVDAVLLRPLPYDEPERLVAVFESAQDRPTEGPSPGNVLDWVARNEAFDALTAWMTTEMTLRGNDGATPVTGVQVTRGFFEVFRTQPLLGRTFADDEYTGARWSVANQFFGREPLLVLSHGLWQTLGADSAVVGRTIRVEGREWRVVGVMPAEFSALDSEAAFWTPWDIRMSYTIDRFPAGPPRDFRFLRVAGRLRADVSIDQANEHMQRIAAGIAREHPQTNRGWSARVVPFGEELVASRRADLLIVFVAVAGLLLLVCANIAGLTVARATERARELAVRMALGAGRERLIRQLIAESGLIALVSLALAVGLTEWWLDAVVAFAPPDIPRLHEVRLDARVVLFAASVAFIVTMVAGVLPALRGTRLSLAPVLREGTAGSGQRRLVLRRVIVVGELAIAVMLLVSAGLLIRTFNSLRSVDVGFEPRNLLVMSITPDSARYRTGVQGAEYYRRVLAELRQVPAVTSVAAASLLPMSSVGSDFDRPFWRDGARPDGDSVPEADVRMVTPQYFVTVGRQLLRGREFMESDTRDAKKVVIVNERLARNTWPGDEPVGRTLILDYQGGAYQYEVVGVVRDARYKNPRTDSRPEIFIPHAQNPYLVMNVVVRTSLPPEALSETVRAYALRVDPEQPVHSVTTMEALVARSMEQEQFGATLLTLFSIAGIVVAATGIYSLCAYSVAQRRREIALRLAVGASTRQVRGLVLGESLLLGLIGCGIGLVGAVAAARVISAALFGVQPTDPLTLVITAATLITVVVGATWWPARRATRIDPALVLRG